MFVIYSIPDDGFTFWRCVKDFAGCGIGNGRARYAPDTGLIFPDGLVVMFSISELALASCRIREFTSRA